MLDTSYLFILLFAVYCLERIYWLYNHVIEHYLLPENKDARYKAPLSLKNFFLWLAAKESLIRECNFAVGQTFGWAMYLWWVRTKNKMSENNTARYFFEDWNRERDDDDHLYCLQRKE